MNRSWQLRVFGERFRRRGDLASAWLFFVFAVLVVLASAFLVSLYPGMAQADPSARLRTNITHDWIEGFDFPGSTSVTVSLNLGAKGQKELSTEGDGHFFATNWSDGNPANQPAPGDVVRAVYAGGTVQMVVQNVQGVVYNETDTVSGTAPADTLIEAGIQPYEPPWGHGAYTASHQTTVSPSGAFAFDYASVAPAHDVEPGDWAVITHFGADGGQTLVVPDNPRPMIAVHPDQNWARVEGLQAHEPVTVAILRGGTEVASWSATAEQQFHNGWYASPDNFQWDYQTGDRITAWPSHETLSMTIAAVSGSVDIGSDKVTVDSTPGEVHVSIWDDWGRHGDSTGAFVADFSTPPEEAYDVKQGDLIKVFHFDGKVGITEYWPYNGTHSLGAFVDRDWVDGWDFPRETTVTVSANGGAKGTREIGAGAGDGFVITDWSGGDPGRRLTAGDTLTATFAGTSTAMTMQNLTATLDLTGNVVSGTALSPGGAPLAGDRVSLMVATQWDTEHRQVLASMEGAVSPSGGYSFNVAPLDLDHGQKAIVTLHQGGHRTAAAPHNPSLATSPDRGWIEGYDFQSETTVTVAVSAGAKGTRAVRTDENGGFHADWRENEGADRPSVGDVVTATYDGHSVRMIVQNLDAFSDRAGDRVTGTAFSPGGAPLAGRMVRVFAGGEEGGTSVSTAVAGNGAFAVDLAPFDLNQGQPLRVVLYQTEGGVETGNQTVLEPYNSVPNFSIMIEHDWVEGWGWPPETSVAVSVNGGAKGTKHTQSDLDGSWRIEGWSEGAEHISTDDLVSGTFATGSKETRVIDVEAGADPGGDRITGTAFGQSLPRSGIRVDVSIYEDWGQDELTSASATVAADGLFTINLAPFDLERGQKIFLTAYVDPYGRQRGSRTMREVYNAIPVLTTWLGGDIEGDGFAYDTTLTVSVNGGAKGTRRIKTGGTENTGFSPGYFWAWGWGGEHAADRPTAGDTVTAAWDGNTVEMVVQDVQGEIDPESDMVTGTGPANQRIESMIAPSTRIGGGGDWTAGNEAFASPSGTFTIDYSGDPPGGYDIKPGDGAILTVTGDDRGRTRLEVRTPVLGVDIDKNSIWAQGFSKDTTITVKVDGGAKGTREIMSNPWGDFQLESWNEGDPAKAITAGDTVTASYDGHTVTMQVQNLVTMFDLSTDFVGGVARNPGGASLGGRDIDILIGGDWFTEEEVLEHKEADTTAGGVFAVGLSPFDLQLGQPISVSVREGGHYTMRSPYNGLPTLAAFLESNRIEGYEFPWETTVTVRVNGGAKGTKEVQTNSEGMFDIWGWGFGQWMSGTDNFFQIGDTITATAEGQTAEMVVADVHTLIDNAGNRITGTAFVPGGGPALSGRRVDLSLRDDEESEDALLNTSTTVTPSGAFAFNLSPFDLQLGQNGLLEVWDAPGGVQSGNKTVRELFNKGYLAAAIEEDYLAGRQFPMETTITVSLNGTGGSKGSRQARTGSRAHYFSSNWRIDEWSGGNPVKRPAAGDTVMAMFNGNLASMVVQDLNATLDTAGDRLTGSARTPGGAPLAGRAVEIEISENQWEEPTWVDTVTAADGSFVVDLAPFDLRPHQQVHLTLWEDPGGRERGNETMRTLNKRPPTFRIQLDPEWLEGYDFPYFETQGTTVTVRVNNGTKYETEVVSDGGFHIENWSGGAAANRITVGDTVSATYSQTAVAMTVNDFDAEIDNDGDRIFGAAQTPGGAPLVGRLVTARVSDPEAEEGEPLATGSATVTATGSFEIDLGAFNLEPGQPVWLTLFYAADGSDSGHRLGVRDPNPVKWLATHLDWQYVQGGGFPAETTVTVWADDGVKGQQLTVTDEDGGLAIWDWMEGTGAQRLVPGDRVKVTQGAETLREMVVQDLDAAVDVATDTASGTAHAPAGSALVGRRVKASVSDTSGEEEESWETSVTALGGFEIDLTGFDLVPGRNVDVTLFDDEGNRTMRRPYNGVPSLETFVDFDMVGGMELPYDTTVTVEGNGGTKGETTAVTDWAGGLTVETWSAGNPADLLEAGDTVTVIRSTDATTLAKMTVQDVHATASVAADRVSGTAMTPAPESDPLAGRLVQAFIQDEFDGGESLAEDETHVATDGTFEIDFSGFDIEYGQKVTVTVWDGEDGGNTGNRTTRGLDLSAPTSLTWSAIGPTSLKYGTAVQLKAVLKSAGETVPARQDVWLERSTNGVNWTRDATATFYDATETYRLSRAILRRVIYRFDFPGGDGYRPSTSARVTFNCWAQLPRPSVSTSRPRRNAYFTTTGTLRPVHSGYTKIYFYYKNSRGKWVVYNRTALRATNRTVGDHTAYSLRYRVPYTGAWKVVAIHEDTDHLKTTSSPRYFTVVR